MGQGAHVLGHRAAERADQLALATLAWRLLGPTSAPFQLVLLRAMSPDPSQRFRSVAGLIEALEEASVSAAPGLGDEGGRDEDARRPILRGRRAAPLPIVVASPSVPAATPPSPGRARRRCLRTRRPR